MSSNDTDTQFLLNLFAIYLLKKMFKGIEVFEDMHLISLSFFIGSFDQCCAYYLML